MPFYKYWQFDLSKSEQQTLTRFRENRERKRVYDALATSVNGIRAAIDGQKIEKTLKDSFTGLMREFELLQKDAATKSGDELERNLALHIFSTAKEGVFDKYNMKGLNFLDAHQLLALYFFSLGKISARTTIHLIFYAIYTAKVHYPQLLRQIVKESATDGTVDDLKDSDGIKDTMMLMVQSVNAAFAVAYGSALCVFLISFTIRALLMVIQNASGRPLHESGAEDYRLFLDEFGSELIDVQKSAERIEGLEQLLDNRL